MGSVEISGEEYIITDITDKDKIIDNFNINDNELKKACKKYLELYKKLNENEKQEIQKIEFMTVLLTKKDTSGKYIIEKQNKLEDIKNIQLDKEDVLNIFLSKNIITNKESYSSIYIKINTTNTTLDKISEELVGEIYSEETQKKIEELNNEILSLKYIKSLSDENHNKNSVDYNLKKAISKLNILLENKSSSNIIDTYFDTTSLKSSGSGGVTKSNEYDRDNIFENETGFSYKQQNDPVEGLMQIMSSKNIRNNLFFKNQKHIIRNLYQSIFNNKLNETSEICNVKNIYKYYYLKSIKNCLNLDLSKDRFNENEAISKYFIYSISRVSDDGKGTKFDSPFEILPKFEDRYLLGFIIHVGSSINSGHYVSYIRSDENNFCEVNDLTVSSKRNIENTISKYNKKNVVMLLYSPKWFNINELNEYSHNPQGRVNLNVACWLNALISLFRTIIPDFAYKDKESNNHINLSNNFQVLQYNIWHQAMKNENRRNNILALINEKINKNDALIFIATQESAETNTDKLTGQIKENFHQFPIRHNNSCYLNTFVKKIIGTTPLYKHDIIEGHCNTNTNNGLRFIQILIIDRLKIIFINYHANKMDTQDKYETIINEAINFILGNNTNSSKYNTASYNRIIDPTDTEGEKISSVKDIINGIKRVILSGDFNNKSFQIYELNINILDKPINLKRHKSDGDNVDNIPTCCKTTDVTAQSDLSTISNPNQYDMVFDTLDLVNQDSALNLTIDDYKNFTSDHVPILTTHSK
jgi:hypothetical protein